MNKQSPSVPLLCWPLQFPWPALCFAQSSGEATYKAKCQMCHGATGTPSPGWPR